ncbi:unnamed protein product [Enterobius vermicularis]|uniref:Fimbrial protein n=1 Tax=Enterobius vermicularis TaxID=51028 RepID=A0A0N4VEW1_ENTVE|nr:unnamed protein product [Enterobius vermicularis]
MRLYVNAFLLLFLPNGINSVAKFQVESVSSNSLVISMTDVANVTKVNMNVKLFDLNQRRIYRETSLYKAQSNQLFSFDQLIPRTWFALRILYLPFYHNRPAKEPLKQV